MLKVAANKAALTKDGREFFWLADTCWSAFTNITDEEWEYYLSYRKEQGFNTLQINILPQWDASETRLHWEPFEKNEDGTWNYSVLKPDYFAHAGKMAEKAKDEGFVLALVVLWCNYIPDTWASRFYKGGIMPFAALDPYLEMVKNTFNALDPVYVISGDTDFNTPECEKYYIHAAEYLKVQAPDSLLATHIKGRYTYIPEALEKQLDLLFYQSGHNRQDLTMPWKLALEMQEKYPGKPLINSEPCYENMGFSRSMYGRWTQMEIRKAAWQSLLAGACAGITYGAAGIYSWHQTYSYFDARRGEGFASPMAWQDALHFAGAWDYGWIRWFFEENGLSRLTPAQDLLVKPCEEIRAARAGEDKVLIYSPGNTPFAVRMDLQGWKGQVYDLEQRRVGWPVLEKDEAGTWIGMHRFGSDVLYLFEKQ